MNFLVIGLGSIGDKHSRILKKLGHTVVTVDPNPKAVANFTTIDNLRPDTFDGGLLCVHPDKRSYVLGHLGGSVIKRWFVEKPVSPNRKSLDELMVGFCYRWLPP